VEFVLPFAAGLQQKHDMENQTSPTGFKAILRWAMTPPQSYAVYLIALLLVFGLSYFAGTMKPKNSAGIGPPPVSAPRN
jgi:hypothetical protein